MTMNKPDSTPNSSAISRRHMLVGTAAVGATWAAPSIVRLDRAAAAAGSCVPKSVTWSSISGPVGNVYTATGSNGSTSVTAQIQRSLSSGATPSVFLSGGRVIIGMRNHQIGDRWRIRLSFTDSAGGVICQASTTLLDIDRNGRGLGCPYNSRFEDNIDQLTGPGLVTTTFGNLTEAPAGNFVSTLTCKTSDTENLGLSWSSGGNITGAGFNWRAGTPPGTDTNLDYQLIKMQPMTVCVQQTGSGIQAASTPTAVLGKIGVVNAEEYD